MTKSSQVSRCWKKESSTCRIHGTNAAQVAAVHLKSCVQALKDANGFEDYDSKRDEATKAQAVYDATEVGSKQLEELLNAEPPPADKIVIEQRFALAEAVRQQEEAENSPEKKKWDKKQGLLSHGLFRDLTNEQLDEGMRWTWKKEVREAFDAEVYEEIEKLETNRFFSGKKIERYDQPAYKRVAETALTRVLSRPQWRKVTALAKESWEPQKSAWNDREHVIKRTDIFKQKTIATELAVRRHWTPAEQEHFRNEVVNNINRTEEMRYRRAVDPSAPKASIFDNRKIKVSDKQLPAYLDAIGDKAAVDAVNNYKTRSIRNAHGDDETNTIASPMGIGSF